jgi:hypothetical protein
VQRNGAAQQISSQQAARRRNHGDNHSYKYTLLEGALHSPGPTFNVTGILSKNTSYKEPAYPVYRGNMGFLHGVVENSGLLNGKTGTRRLLLLRWLCGLGLGNLEEANVQF